MRRSLLGRQGERANLCKVPPLLQPTAPATHTHIMELQAHMANRRRVGIHEPSKGHDAAPSVLLARATNVPLPLKMSVCSHSSVTNDPHGFFVKWKEMEFFSLFDNRIIEPLQSSLPTLC